MNDCTEHLLMHQQTMSSSLQWRQNDTYLQKNRTAKDVVDIEASIVVCVQDFNIPSVIIAFFGVLTVIDPTNMLTKLCTTCCRVEIQHIAGEDCRSSLLAQARDSIRSLG
jgi:hypothetical protein